MHLYTGKILKIDLTRREVTVESIPDQWLREYWGGWGLAAKYFVETACPDEPAFSPHTPLVIFTGPFAGTLAPTSARLCLVSKSPHTGTIFESNTGGAFAPELKMAGYDGMVITGRSDAWVYLRIEDDRVVIEDAASLTGLGSLDTEARLLDIVGDRSAKTLTIGPAGENMVSFACVNTEAFRQMGRGGAGALFGSKRLKGIACLGSGAVSVADMELFRERVDHHKKNSLLTVDNLWAKIDGTAEAIESSNEMGIHPTRNYTYGVNDQRRGIDAEAVRAAKTGDRACTSCPLGCGKFTHINGAEVEGPEYETLCLAGSNCEINDLEAIIRFNRICDDLGLDTITAGSVIGMAMDMTEQGVYDFDLRFGEKDSYLAVVEEIAWLSTDRGKDLAMGAKRLAEKYGAQDFSQEVKGLEFPGFEPRGNYGIALAYATSERGACHMRSLPLVTDDPFDLDAMAEQVMNEQNLAAIKWSMCFCDFWGTVDTDIMADLLSVGLGYEVTPEELILAGERIWNLTRVYNNEAGFTSTDDSLPNKMWKQTLKNGPHQNRTLSLEDFYHMLARYYELRGWDEQGRPLPDKLKALGLTEVSI
jgi:aldehyde:ferredoxin oxidoreductase